MTTDVSPQKPQLSPGMKLLLDLGPLALFMAAYYRPQWFTPLVAPFLPEALVSGEHAGIYVATSIFVPTVLVALAVSYVLTRHLPVMPVVTAVVVTVFGGLTLFFQDESFIKMKPTIVYLLFAGTLLGGLLFRRALLGMVFDSVFQLTEEGWRKLTLRWGLFFLAMAILNEFVWRTQTTTLWINFKAFGFTPLTFLFAMAQFPLLQRHAIPEAAEKK